MRRLFFICCWLTAALRAEPRTELRDQPPVTIRSVASGVWLIDFGRVAFGNLRLSPDSLSPPLTVRLGEALREGRIDRHPPGSVRYSEILVSGGRPDPLLVAPAADRRNTAPPAVLTPPEWGVVTPFRWVEIEGWPGELRPGQIRRRAAFPTGWDDDAARFHSSDEMLNRIWDLCHYSIKATGFAGIYVDGDRERIAYEADAYLNQLGDYACDSNPRMARATFDRLIQFPTWPTEWAAHVIFMAGADWNQTGDRAWLAAHYDRLKPKLLLERARADGLLTSTAAQMEKGDLVDWPQGERDGFVFTPVNSVVNAFHLRALTLMAELAQALGRTDEAAAYAARARTTGQAFQTAFFDPTRGIYRDGEGTDHASLHANLFPLAFRLVPPGRGMSVLAYVKSKGMACSVYGAQYLLQGLFENGASETALQLIAAPGDRSWRHMVDNGATITWEAWDQRFKPNQDWNHAWGTAPANLLPRYVLGVRAAEPGWPSILIHPHPGNLTNCSGRVPTPLGPVELHWSRGDSFRLQFALPAGMGAHLTLPVAGLGQVWVDGRPAPASRIGAWAVVSAPWTGTHQVEVK